MVLHLSITCTDNYTGDIDLINYVYKENNSVSDSMNSTWTQTGNLKRMIQITPCKILKVTKSLKPFANLL